MRTIGLALALSTLLVPTEAVAWGGRGHHLICVVASRMVEEPGLAKLLDSRGDVMGHLCNVPDIYWKSREDWRKVGDPAHYLNPETVGREIDKLPLDFQEFSSLLNVQTQLPVGHTAGSLWWRADQFVRIATAEALKARESAPPSSRGDEQRDELPYNSGVYQMIVHMGLLGHYVGDASMPFHNHSDYDGRAEGHAGIHSFFEEQAVSVLPLSLIVEVEKKASELRRRGNYKVGSVLERMKRLSTRAVEDRLAVLKADELKPQDPTHRPDAPARPPVTQAAEKFRALIVREMADSAAQLAQFWDDIYIGGGRPDLAPYRSYRYPFTPDFVSPDYLDPKTKPSPGASPATPPPTSKN